MLAFLIDNIFAMFGGRVFHQTVGIDMGQNLRNAIYQKGMYHNKFLEHETDKNWETYRKQRNLVTKLKKKLEHADDIRFREHFGRIRVFCLQNKICYFLAQGICVCPSA